MGVNRRRHNIYTKIIFIVLLTLIHVGCKNEIIIDDPIEYTDYKLTVNYADHWKLYITYFEYIDDELTIYNNVISEGGVFIYQLSQSTASEVRLNITFTVVIPQEGLDDSFGYVGDYFESYILTDDNPIIESSFNIEDVYA